MDAAWFYMESIPGHGETAWLQRDEVRHATSSRRLSSDDTITLFDGRGTVARAILGRQRDPDGGLEVRIESIELRNEPVPLIELVSAMPKGDRITTMLDGAAQAGMSEFRPLDCEHSRLNSSSIRHQRWRRVLLSACKQSRRPHVPRVLESMDVSSRLASVGEDELLLALHPGGIGFTDLMQGLDASARPSRISMMIGPEGGFSQGELDEITAAGVQCVDLGEGILRIEIAAIISCALAAQLACWSTG